MGVGPLAIRTPRGTITAHRFVCRHVAHAGALDIGGCVPGQTATLTFPDAESCAFACAKMDGCGFFSFTDAGGACALYAETGGCKAPGKAGAGVSSYKLRSSVRATTVMMTDRAHTKLETLVKQVKAQMGKA